MKRRVVASVVSYLASLSLILILILAAVGYWAIGEQLPKESNLQIENPTNAPLLTPPKQLKVVSYNIGHGQGVKTNPWDPRSKEETLEHLTLLADAMNAMDADIFMLQEVDLDSHRSHRINEMEFIKERTGHAYHACSIFWQKNYVPFPYWPPKDQIGYIRAANCVLSKFPLSNHQRFVFDKPKSNPFWYNWAYINYGMQKVEVTIGEKKIAILNLHLDAFDFQTRELQVAVVAEKIKQIDKPIILAGDFNTILPSDPIKTGFPDYPPEDYTKEQTFKSFFTSVPDLKIYELKETDNALERYTFPSNAPTRRLDHIFLLGGLSFINFRVVFEAKTASDHFPVMGIISY